MWLRAEAGTTSGEKAAAAGRTGSMMRAQTIHAMMAALRETVFMGYSFIMRRLPRGAYHDRRRFRRGVSLYARVRRRDAQWTATDDEHQAAQPRPSGVWRYAPTTPIRTTHCNRTGL